MKVGEIVERAAATLAEAGIPTPQVDAEWIVAHALGMNRSDLVADSHKVREGAAVWALVERRAAREPLAYVLGEWGFRRLTLRCDARALVPRPETEQVVERCLELLRNVASPRILDVGTGTGAIAFALKDERRDASVVALDESADALVLARENADEMDVLDPEVRDWEPRAALVDEGQTAALVRAARAVLATGGHLVLEVHAAGAADVVLLFEEAGYSEVRITQDLAERDRVVEGESR